MEKLNDLVLLVNSKNNPFDNYSTVKDETILAIAEAFGALEQRAEAAEAKLAELEKQKSVGTVSIAMDWNTHRNIATVNMRPDLVVAEMKDGDELFTRPAPAINLAELVPHERSYENYIDSSAFMTMHEALRLATEWNTCRAAILRKIEKVNK